MLKRSGLVFVLVVLLFLAGAVFGGVKVHKGQIIVQRPDEKGVVHVHGAAGAIQSSSPAVVYIENLTTKSKIRINVNDDGGFEASIPATSKDRVRVRARNQEGKVSYGTFDVPVGQQADAAEAVVESNEEVDEPIQLRPLLGHKRAKRIALEMKGSDAGKQDKDYIGLAVIITVVNINTGEVVAAERIAGKTKHTVWQNDLFNRTVQRIISRCFNIIRSEINRPNLHRRESLEKQNKLNETQGKKRLGELKDRAKQNEPRQGSEKVEVKVKPIQPAE